jgi:hypothetical protein
VDWGCSVWGKLIPFGVITVTVSPAMICDIMMVPPMLEERINLALIKYHAARF